MCRGKRNQNLMRETARKWRMATGQVSVNSTTVQRRFFLEIVAYALLVLEECFTINEKAL